MSLLTSIIFSIFLIAAINVFGSIPDTPNSILSLPESLCDKFDGLSSATILPSEITNTLGHIVDTSGRIWEEISRV